MAILYSLAGIVILGYVYAFASIMPPEDEQRFWWVIARGMFLSPAVVLTATGLSLLAMAVRTLIGKCSRDDKQNSSRVPNWFLLVSGTVLVILIATL